MLKRFLIFLLVSFFACLAWAQVVVSDDFEDGDYTADPAWSVHTGVFAADGSDIGNFRPTDDLPDPNTLPEEAYYGMLAFGTQAFTEIAIDWNGQGPDPLQDNFVTIEFKLKQTDSTDASFHFDVAIEEQGVGFYDWEMSPSATIYGGVSGFMSYVWDGGQQTYIKHVGTAGENLNQSRAFQVIKIEFDPLTGVKYYKDDVLVGQWPNFNGLSTIDKITLWHTGTVSWFIDDVTVEVEQPYILRDDFEDEDISDWTIESGTWHVSGEAGGGPWGAQPGKLASADEGARISKSFPATTPGDIVTLTVDVHQPNGTTGSFPLEIGFRDADSADYYVEIPSPNQAYYGNSGFMAMVSDDPTGNGDDPWWSFLPGEPNQVLSWDPGIGDRWTNSIEMVFDPWSGVTVKIDGMLAASWPNFRQIESVDEIFLGNRDGVVTWQFDNVSLSITTPECGDYGYPQMDFNQDCIVDIEDFASFILHWLDCTPPVCMPMP